MHTPPDLARTLMPPEVALSFRRGHSDLTAREFDLRQEMAVMPVFKPLCDKGQLVPNRQATRFSVLLTGGARFTECSGSVLQTRERQIGIGYRSRNIMTDKGQFGDRLLAATPPTGPAE
jgi:hypothetical protein